MLQQPSLRAPGHLTRRGALAMTALTLGAACLPGGAARAADWPARPVRIIVPFAPGGGADSSARVLAELLGPQLGQPVVVENRPGAGSTIGVLAAAQSRDGHTLLMGSNSMVINPVLNPAVTYDVARDFDAIGMVSSQPLVLVVPSTSDIRSFEDLVARSREPGAKLNAGNSGNGTLAHLTAELFALQTGASITSVPYRGESALMPDLISGLVSFGFLNLPSVVAHIRSGRLRALGVSAGEPVAELPGVPTLRALGQPALEVQGWAALLAPKGTIAPAELDRLGKLLAQALASDAVRERFAALSVAPMARSREASAQLLQAEGARWRELIRSRGIKVES